MRRYAIAVLLLAAPGLPALPLAAASAAPVQVAFHFQTFDVPGAMNTQINGVNDSGVFEGTFTDAAGQHGFVRGPAGLIRFDVPGTHGVTQGFAIDNGGDVIGVSADAAGASHGYLRHRNGHITTLPSPPGAGTGRGQGTFPAGITDSGEIVGYYIGDDGVAHGYTQSPGGQFTVINAPGAGDGPNQGTLLFSVDDRGIIGGTYFTSGGLQFGLVDRNGHLTSIDDPATPQNSTGGTLADGFARGLVVGDFGNQHGSERGFVERDGHFQTIADPHGNNQPGQGTIITATNDRLTLSGFYFSRNGVEHGLIAYPH